MPFSIEPPGMAPARAALASRVQPIGHARLAIGKPGFRIKRHGQSWRRLRRLSGHQGLLQIAVAPGMSAARYRRSGTRRADGTRPPPPRAGDRLPSWAFRWRCHFEPRRRKPIGRSSGFCVIRDQPGACSKGAATPAAWISSARNMRGA